jgi:hypothetical protein
MRFPDADMTTADVDIASKRRQARYWRLWLANAMLVSAAALYFLATRFGTTEFLGRACLMALLPLIPVLVLVGGAGSTIFVLTKVWIERRALGLPAELALLLGPGLAVSALLVLVAVGQPASHRLAYVCLGHAPPSATAVRVTGYSTYLRAEWLAVFQVPQKEFQTMTSGAQLIPADAFEVTRALSQSSLAQTAIAQKLPRLDAALSFKRIFNEAGEHQRGGIFAAYDPATSTAVVLREYRD